MIKLYLLLCLSVVLYCSGCTTNVAGTISETDTGCKIAGIVNDKDGKAVHNAVVVIHDNRNVLPSFPADHRSVDSMQPADTTVTDENGLFLFDSVDTGDFLIEVTHLDSLGTIIPITIKHSDTLIETQGVVKRDGTIIGKIDALVAGSKVKIAVLVRELGRIVKVDSSGAFTFCNLPEWKYHLSIVHDVLIDTCATATALVPVASGNTSRITGLGSPSGMTVVEDSVKFVHVYFNTDSGNGGGIAFLEKDSTLKLRLLIGQKNRYYQADVTIGSYKADTASTLTSIDENSSLAIMNGDGLLSKFKIIKSDSYLMYKLKPDTTRLKGNIVITGISDDSLYTSVNISGSFTADIGPDEENSWNCDFGDTICSCWFLK